MSNKKTAVEQAYLERAQVLKETEGAPESTRVALSAISGRNILKTKKETAKIERDKQIAAMQQQALLQQGAAGSALKMGQAKLSAAIQEDQNRRADAFRFMDAGIYDDTLAATLDAQQAQAMQYAEIARQNSALEQQRRSEAISILKMGVYDPSMPQTLGFSESVVKSFADQRAAEIEDAIAKRKAAEKAQAEYEAALRNLQAANGDVKKAEEEKKPEWYEDNIDAAINAFEEDNPTVTNPNEAKKQIVEAANVEKVFIPWADPEPKLDLSSRAIFADQFAITPLNTVLKEDLSNEYYTKGLMAGVKKPSTGPNTKVAFDYFAEKEKNKLPNAYVNNPVAAKAAKEEQERIKKAKEKLDQQAKNEEKYKKQREAELEQAKKNREKAERYYEQAMAKRVAAKEAADQALSALENSYKKSEIGKVYIAKEKINSAKTATEMETAYQNYAQQVAASVKKIAGNASKVQETAYDRYVKGENLTDDELQTATNQIDELKGIQYVLQDAIDAGVLTEEGEKSYGESLGSIEKMILSLEAAQVYAETYNEDDAIYRAMDAQYGGRTLEELETEAYRLEQELKTEYDVEIIPSSELSRAKGMMAQIDKENDPRYKTHQNILKYIEWRKDEAKTIDEDMKASTISSNFDGETYMDRMNRAIESYGAVNDEYNRYKEFRNMNESGLYSLYEVEKPDWLGAEVVSETGGRYGYTGKQYRFYFNASNGEKWEWSGGERGVSTNPDGKYVSFAELEKRNKENLEKQRVLTNTFHRISEEETLQSLQGKDVEQLAKEFADNYDSKAFRSFGGKKYKYATGDEGKSDGWYYHFYSDVDRFVQGDYGFFSKEDAQTVLALLQDAGEDETKQDLAFSYYTKMEERAKRAEVEDMGFGAWVAGLVSAPIEMAVNGIFMLDNAANERYARVGSTVFGTAHQVTMEEFSKKTGIGNDALEFLYQAGYTVVDMVPVVALSAIPYVGNVAGSAYLYAKSLATTYDDAIRNGKRADEALTYATLTAALEVLLEKALSGIKNVGGSKSLGNTFSKAIEKLSTTSGVKTALKLAGNMGSEGFEEFLQEVLSPFLEKFAADVNGMTDAELGEIDWDEAGKSFLLGAITGGVFSAFDVGSEYSSANQQAILSKIALQGDGKDAIKIIQMAADLGNQRAIRIKTAMKSESPIYKDQAGVRQYASEADITNLRKSIRSKNKKVMLQNIRAELEGDATRDHSTDDRIYGIFKELLLNHRLDVHQTADLINDPTALKILNRITGENVGAMMPTDAMYLARIASFTDKDGQVDHARIDALKDSFGELDYKAIEQILKYEDIVAEQRAEGNFSGVLYEDPAVQEALSENQKMITEEMKAVSDMTGFYFLVGNNLETGKYLGRNLLAVNSSELEKGAWYLICHNAYEMMQRFDQKKGKVFKDVLWNGITEMIGENGIETEKKKLRQQGVDEKYLEDELCARMLPSVLMRGSYEKIGELVKTDPATAESLCLILDSIRRHINTNFNTQDVDVLRNAKISPVDFEIPEGAAPFFEELSTLNPNYKTDCEKVIKKMARDLRITGRKYSMPVLDFEFSFGQNNGLSESLHQQGEYGGDYMDFAKVMLNLEKVLNNAVLIEEHSDKYVGKVSEDTDLIRVYVLVSVLQEGNMLIPVQLEVKRRLQGDSILYMTVAAKKTEADVMGRTGSQKDGDGKSLVSTSTYSISEIFDKINTIDKKIIRYIPDVFLSNDQITKKTDAIGAENKRINDKEDKGRYELRALNREINALYDRLSEAIKRHQAERAELLANSNPDYETDVEITVDPDLLPQVAKDFIRRAENELMETLGFNLRGKQSEWARSIVEKMANEYLLSEDISERGKQLLHEAADSYLSPENVDATINAFQKKMQIANRYVAERMAINAEKNNRIETTSELEEAYKDLKAARSKYENASRKQLLTSEDRQTIGRLLRGDLTVEEISSNYVNADGIIAVYKAKAEYEKISKRIRAYNAVRKEKLRNEANALLKNISNWKDKKTGWQYMRETMERNIYDIASSPEEAAALIEWVFKPIHDATATMTQMKKDYRARIKALKLKTRRMIGDEVSESYAVQLLGEAQDNIRVIEESDGRITEKDGKTREEWQALINDLWISSPKIDKTKIENAVKEFRAIYDELFEMMNEVRLRNGYEPVDYRSGYFPHFQPGESEGVMALFCKAFDINPNVDILPTTINGLTHTFRPGIQWFGNAKRRIGFETGYDAVRGFDKYIEGIASVIHQTDNIQKLRALAAQIRYLASDEGIQQQVDDINSDPQLEEEDKANRLEKIYKGGKFSLSNFVNELDEYTNLLANKKSGWDRRAEALLGRKFYTAAKWAENRIAGNMVGGNLSSALTNTIPVQMGMAEVGEINIIKAHLQMIASWTSDDGFVARSAFLTSRRGSDPLVRSWSEWIADKAGKPMEWIDRWASEVLVRARYIQNINKGLSEKSAIEEADSWAAGLMADRSKGSMPTIFESRNPLVKIFTMFQLEVNNQFSYLFKDLPRRYGKQEAGRLALVLFKMALGALLFNDTFEKFFGRRPAFDPLGILNDAVGDFSGYKLPNVIDIAYGLVGGEMPSFETEKKDFEDASLELVTDASNELPFIGGYLGGGRFPISSAMVDFTNVWKGIVSQDWSTEKKIDALSKEFGKLFYYYAIPTAGGQVKKLVEGSFAVHDGGSYTITADGEKKLQYVVEPGDVWQAALLGKSSLESANEWVKSDFDSLSVDETKIYQKLTEQGLSGGEAVETIRTISEMKDDSGKVDKDAQREYILGLDFSDNQKYTLYKGTLSDSVAEKIDGLVSANVDRGAVMKAYAEYRTIDEDSRYEQSEKDKATEFAYFVDNLVDNDQAEKIKSSITYGVLGVTRATEYEEMVASGASFDEAYDAYFGVASLKPEGENKTVKSVAKYGEIMDANISETGSRAALIAYASDADARRMVLAFEEGVDAECFVDIKMSIEHLNDLEGKNTASNARIEAAIRHEDDLSNRQRAALWQLFSTSDSAKNNPFSVSVGTEILAKVKAYKETEEE